MPLFLTQFFAFPVNPLYSLWRFCIYIVNVFVGFFATGTSMEEVSLQIPAYQWSETHLKSLHIDCTDDVEMSNFVFAEFIPGDEDPNYRALKDDLEDISAEDITRMSPEAWGQYQPNGFLRFFTSVAYASRTDNLEMMSEDESGRMPSIKCLAFEFLEAIMGDEKLHQTPLKIGPRQDGKYRIAQTYGAIVVRRQVRIQKTPIVTIVAKPRNSEEIGGYPTNGEEPFRAEILAQEVARLYGQACACSVDQTDQVVSGHDGWVLAFHGTRMRVVYAYFPKAYLESVRGQVLPSKERIEVLRSVQLNLKFPDQRVQALKAVMGLLRFLQAGTYDTAYLKRLGARR
ncbi:hypothetical protein BO78DRAFT_423006 [Aspergillus sclerotiicarbonarius CBS 121057]|uniref:Uncharacterized protein n=1 Tax=Aspergillus sclerotiicarbonarius (strain CBS 121057 / IBT 28362) TaxID=1448318 RepID=A0A319DW24_ASPSB|nr:hypothetical protein BO78DRAFT_423006 [Aspergillus sclerotiicarbonarius CBS 121057]